MNEPWHFVIDLVSCDPSLEIAMLPGRPAGFTLLAGHPVIEGEIIDACQVYAGTCLSHYRIRLGPRLQRLANPPRQRLFCGRSSLQLIEQLLSENGLDPHQVRFEHLHGVYPLRSQCVQYQESDLHLLQRLCEEEGIHFCFDGAQLVFSDDPAGFPERHEPLLFNLSDERSGLLDHFHEFLALHSVTPMLRHTTDGATQRSAPPAWQVQRHNRELERLRGTARRVSGQSRDATLRCGQVVRIARHPEQRYNDHWLITCVYHHGRQAGVFEGHDPHDIAAIIHNLASGNSNQWGDTASAAALENHSGAEYRNSFTAQPWTRPFRPALSHPKPRITGLHAATLLDSQANDQGKLSLRIDWQAPGSEPALAQLVPGRLPADQPIFPGSRVLVAYLDGDPERPAICALLSAGTPAHPLRLSLNGRPITPGTGLVTVQHDEHLQIRAGETLNLSGASANIRLDRQGIEITAARVQLTQYRQCQPLQDLQLAAHGAPLGNCVWYIANMQKPGLENLSLLDPEHVLFEGRTDEHGYLGMTADQLHRLAEEYARNPQTLCLLHAGHCITLRQYLRQSSNDALH